MDEKILLKKYSNRRLYDTRKSRYVTLEDLTGMIKSGNQVKIIDAATKADVTAFILTQVILEEARKKNILLPEPVLHLIIQHGDGALSEFFDKYLHKTIQNYLEYKKAFDDQFSKWLEVGTDMSKLMPNMMEGPATMENFMQMFMPSGKTQPEGSDRDKNEDEHSV
ncbi:MAG: transcriptional regulator [Deltaproteobacteria bacterium]|nr:transcriptional regulator [Deltaproteobacteria bacterium]